MPFERSEVLLSVALARASVVLSVLRQIGNGHGLHLAAAALGASCGSQRNNREALSADHSSGNRVVHAAFVAMGARVTSHDVSSLSRSSVCKHFTAL